MKAPRPRKLRRPAARRFLDGVVSHERAWIVAIFVVACLLRLIWPTDVEYKLDEEYMFDRTQAVFRTERWPWLGMESGVHVRNPGMSVWIFIGLAKLFFVSTPIGMSVAVMALNSAAIGLLLWIIVARFRGTERETWLWGLTLGAVNPFAVMYQRKIWAQSVLPIFTAVFLWCWWERKRARPAFFWGLVGACLGQIHMSGYFLASAFALWTVIFERNKTAWKAWFFGSSVGALPIAPWLHYLATTERSQPVTHGIAQVFELRFWIFWISDSFGIHLGNPLGVTLGNSWTEQLRDFLSYPLWNGDPTYLVGALHVAFLILIAFLILPAAQRTITRLVLTPNRWMAEHGRGDGSDSARAINAAFWFYGGLLTLSLIQIRRYYLVITFPLEFVWLARTQFKTWAGRPGIARVLLGCLAGLQLLMTCAFLHYIHVNAGAPRGDYGEAYWKKAERLGTAR